MAKGKHSEAEIIGALKQLEAGRTAIKEDPFSGQVFVFRGKRGDLIKLLLWDGEGLCLFAKRLERGRFIWPEGCGIHTNSIPEISPRFYRPPAKG